MAQAIKQLKKKYKGEWLAIKVLEDKKGQEAKGKLVGHNIDRRDLHQDLRKKKVRGVYITYAGPVVKSGYAVML